MGILFRIGLLWLLATAAMAHDKARPELDGWFNELRTTKGELCCSVGDGVIVADPDWDTKDGHYRVYLEGRWLVVPDNAVIDKPNLDGRTIVWPVKGYLGTTIRCFIPGSMT